MPITSLPQRLCAPTVLDGVKLAPEKLHNRDLVLEDVWNPNNIVFKSRGKGEECVASAF